ncbi:Calcium-binding protein 39 [Sphaceloma murrayae]|uniref:Calcium-binding protein 39 n=1 Tax=Sphaceloma murrayae TaxID=2082308 RepID=A0A2K1QU50_9PEZI|nr:Calcium-binding protein 39 [Sphaceloma murrayae]
MPGTPPRSITSTWRADPQAMTVPPPPLANPPPAPVHPLVPFMPFQAVTAQGSDFVVHHICIRCHRPRSVNYHKEHPVIPGRPPRPSGLCGTCKHELELIRQSSRQESDSGRKRHDQSESERFERSRSETVRPTNRISIHLHQNVGTSNAEQPSSSHIIRETTDGRSSIPSRNETTSQQKTKTQSDKRISSQEKQNHNDYGYSQSQRSLSPREVLAQSQKLDDILETKTAKWVENHSVSSKSKVPPSPTVPSPVASVPSTVKSSSKISRSETSIRRIAREEVSRYRQAERQLERHPQPYAHKTATSLTNKATTEEQPVTQGLASQVPQTDTSVSSKFIPAPSKTTRRSTSTAPQTCRSEAPIPPIESTNADWRQRRDSGPKDTHIARVASVQTERSTKAGSKISSEVASPQPGRAQQSMPLQNLPVVDNDSRQRFANRYTIRRRRSFETDYTIQPGSSISQRPPVYHQTREDVDAQESFGLDQIRTGARDTIESARSDKEHSKVDGNMVGSAGPQMPPQIKHSVTQRLPVLPKAKEDMTTRSINDSSIRHAHRPPQYVDRPPSPPSPPPMDRRSSDEFWTYEEEISPNRYRVVRERLIRSRPASPEPHEVMQVPTRQPKVKRYEIVESVRSLPEERGRTKVRDGDGKRKEKHLRSILRSPSASQYDAQNARSDSISRRVSFSEAIDITMLSPPPSSSDLGQAHSRARLVKGGAGRTRYPQYDRHDEQYDAHDNEKYYYERTRRPDPQELARSARIPDTESDAEADRRRALARALSESPSRERGIGIADNSRASRKLSSFYSQYEGAPPEPLPAPGPLTYPMPVSGRGSDHSDGLGPYAPFASPTSSMASNDGRLPILMSGGLSGFSTVRSGTQRSSALSREAYDDVSRSTRAAAPRQSDVPPPPPVSRSDQGCPSAGTRYDAVPTPRSASEFYPSSHDTRRDAPSTYHSRPRSSTVTRDRRDVYVREDRSDEVGDQRSSRRGLGSSHQVYR